MEKKPKRRYQLPKKIIVIPNPDKEFHESWDPERDELDIPHPFRCVMLGPPNSGKSLMVKNILMRAYPVYKEVLIVHCDPEYTKDYEDLGHEGVQMLSEIPKPEEWPGEVKTLCILDDLEFKRMSKEGLRSLDRLFGYVSTHKNVSVMLCCQDTFNVPPIVRRCSNLFVFWKMNDIDSMSTVARKTGLSAAKMQSIFKHNVNSEHDSLWIDMTHKSPYPLRKNGYIMLKPSTKDSYVEEDEITEPVE
jgi:hypothetical protein